MDSGLDQSCVLRQRCGIEFLVLGLAELNELGLDDADVVGQLLFHTIQIYSLGYGRRRNKENINSDFAALVVHLIDFATSAILRIHQLHGGVSDI